MKYLPAINLWDRAIDSAIKSGQLKLQVGQWVTCGTDTQKSRFISCDNGVYNVCHGSNNKEVIKRFNARIEARKQTIKRFGKI